MDITADELYKMKDDWTFRELLDGILHKMASPNIRHQRVVGELYWQLYSQYRNRECDLLQAPCDVQLEEKVVVQPDLFVVCDKTKITELRCMGAPDFIVEVISPSTFKKDTIYKKNLYEKHKVKEYWIIYPAEKIILRYVLEGDAYGEPEHFSEDDTEISLTINPDIKIDIERLFKNT